MITWTQTRRARGTFAALHAEAEDTGDYPRVTLPSGLSGRVIIVPATPAGRYAISLLGFGVGDINVNAVVDADADVTTEVDAALRARPDFIASLRHRQANPRLTPGPHGLSPLEQGRDRWLADLDAAALPAEQRTRLRSPAMQIDLFATDAEAARTPATRIPATPDPVTVQAALFAPPVTAFRPPHHGPAAAPLDPTLHTDTLT